jgi:hypothetical protein
VTYKYLVCVFPGSALNLIDDGETATPNALELSLRGALWLLPPAELAALFWEWVKL